MKILNKNKIIVSALALAIGASLAGSVSGTIAWYQYSTRANVSFIGQSGGFSGNLQMRFVSEASKENPDTYWRTRITWQEMNAELASHLAANETMKIVPMTFGALDKDQALPTDGYTQPRPGERDMTKWVKATNKNYAQFQLQLRYNERDGELENNVDAKNVEKDVYLTKLLIQQDANNGQKGDLTDAIRVHVASSYGNQSKNRLISSLGKEVATKGVLDIDGDGHNDQTYPENDEFGFGYDNQGNRNTLSDVIYGDDLDDSTEEIQRSYKATATDSVTGVKYTDEEIAEAQQANPDFDKTTDDWKVEPVYPGIVYSENNRLFNDSTKQYTPVPSKAIGTTVAGSDSYLTVTVTIWVEGWQKLDNSETAIWDTKYIDSSFNVGIQFAVQDELA